MKNELDHRWLHPWCFTLCWVCGAGFDCGLMNSLNFINLFPLSAVLIYFITIQYSLRKRKIDSDKAYREGYVKGTSDQRKEWEHKVRHMVTQACQQLLHQYPLDIKIVDPEYMKITDWNTGKIKIVGEMVSLPEVIVCISLSPKSIYCVRHKEL